MTSTTTMIHNVTALSCGPVHYSNSNAITLRAEIKDYRGEGICEITLFDLPLAAAEHISRALSGSFTRIDEAAIRADERAKVTARFNEVIGGAA